MGKDASWKAGRSWTKDILLLLSGLQQPPFIWYFLPCIDPAPLHTIFLGRCFPRLSSFACPCLQLASASLHLTNPSSPQIPIILIRFIRVFPTEFNMCLCVYVCVVAQLAEKSHSNLAPLALATHDDIVSLGSFKLKKKKTLLPTLTQHCRYVMLHCKVASARLAPF